MNEKLTAYALNELPPHERAELEAQMKSDPALREQAEEMKTFCSLLSKEMAGEESPALTLQQRASVMRAFTSDVPEKKIARPLWRHPALLVPTALAACVAFALVWDARQAKRSSYASMERIAALETQLSENVQVAQGKQDRKVPSPAVPKPAPAAPEQPRMELTAAPAPALPMVALAEAKASATISGDEVRLMKVADGTLNFTEPTPTTPSLITHVQTSSGISGRVFDAQSITASGSIADDFSIMNGEGFGFQRTSEPYFAGTTTDALGLQDEARAGFGVRYDDGRLAGSATGDLDVLARGRSATSMPELKMEGGAIAGNDLGRPGFTVNSDALNDVPGTYPTIELGGGITTPDAGSTVHLGGHNQIADTSIIRFDAGLGGNSASTGGKNSYFKLQRFSDTVAGIADYSASGVTEGDTPAEGAMVMGGSRLGGALEGGDHLEVIAGSIIGDITAGNRSRGAGSVALGTTVSGSSAGLDPAKTYTVNGVAMVAGQPVVTVFDKEPKKNVVISPDTSGGHAGTPLFRGTNLGSNVIAGATTPGQAPAPVNSLAASVSGSAPDHNGFGLVKSGAGVWNLSGNNTFEGTVALDSPSALGDLNGTGALQNSSANSATLNSVNVGSDSGGVTKTGAGTMTLSGLNTYTGGTAVVSGGSLEIAGKDESSGTNPSSQASLAIVDQRVAGNKVLPGHGKAAGEAFRRTASEPAARPQLAPAPADPLAAVDAYAIPPHVAPPEMGIVGQAGGFGKGVGIGGQRGGFGAGAGAGVAITGKPALVNGIIGGWAVTDSAATGQGVAFATDFSLTLATGATLEHQGDATVGAPVLTINSSTTAGNAGPPADQPFDNGRFGRSIIAGGTSGTTLFRGTHLGTNGPNQMPGILGDANTITLDPQGLADTGGVLIAGDQLPSIVTAGNRFTVTTAPQPSTVTIVTNNTAPAIEITVTESEDQRRERQRLAELTAQRGRHERHLVELERRNAEIARRNTSNESYTRIYENPFLFVKQQPLSTFSIDVDTASYANVRRFLNEGQRPPPDAVRLEELINYFPYAYEGPGDGKPFGVMVDVAEAPWQPLHRLVRVALKGREVKEDRGLANFVFLVDVSGSMQSPDKLPLVQRSLEMLTRQLGENDRVAMVVYAGSSGLVLPSTPGTDREAILDAIGRLQAGGSTNGAGGITQAYQEAAKHFIKGGVNRVILCTDGDFNVGISSPEALEKLIAEKAKSRIFLSVLGFGTGNLKDRTMETLADKGNGNYAYIDSLSEARKVLVEQMNGTLVTIAKDVKIQVEFNPTQVAAYRLLGYENRLMAKEDFNNDKKDAGEIGAGHTVTALYEVVPATVKFPDGRPMVDELKYAASAPKAAEAEAFKADAPASNELMTVKLRYKQPEGDKSDLLEVPVTDQEKKLADSDKDFQFAASTAGFGMLLRGSEHAGELTWDMVRDMALRGKGEDALGYRGEFLQLIDKARGLTGQRR